MKQSGMHREEKTKDTKSKREKRPDNREKSAVDRANPAEEAAIGIYRLGLVLREARAFGNGGRQEVRSLWKVPTVALAEKERVAAQRKADIAAALQGDNRLREKRKTATDKAEGSFEKESKKIPLSEAGAKRLSAFYRALMERGESGLRELARTRGVCLSLSVVCDLRVEKNRLIVTRKSVLSSFARPGFFRETIGRSERSERDVFLLPDGVLVGL